MNWDKMTCWEMFTNGAATGKRIILRLLNIIPKVLRVVIKRYQEELFTVVQNQLWKQHSEAATPEIIPVRGMVCVW